MIQNSCLSKGEHSTITMTKKSCSAVFVTAFFNLKGRNMIGPGAASMIEKNKPAQRTLHTAA